MISSDGSDVVTAVDSVVATGNLDEMITVDSSLLSVAAKYQTK